MDLDAGARSGFEASAADPQAGGEAPMDRLALEGIEPGQDKV
jgi:hypothetical protein